MVYRREYHDKKRELENKVGERSFQSGCILSVVGFLAVTIILTIILGTFDGEEMGGGIIVGALLLCYVPFLLIDKSKHQTKLNELNDEVENYIICHKCGEYVDNPNARKCYKCNADLINKKYELHYGGRYNKDKHQVEEWWSCSFYDRCFDNGANWGNVKSDEYIAKDVTWFDWTGDEYEHPTDEWVEQAKQEVIDELGTYGILPEQIEINDDFLRKRKGEISYDWRLVRN